MKHVNLSQQIKLHLFCSACLCQHSGPYPFPSWIGNPHGTGLFWCKGDDIHLEDQILTTAFFLTIRHDCGGPSSRPKFYTKRFVNIPRSLAELPRRGLEMYLKYPRRFEPSFNPGVRECLSRFGSSRSGQSSAFSTI